MKVGGCTEFGKTHAVLYGAILLVTSHVSLQPRSDGFLLWDSERYLSEGDPAGPHQPRQFGPPMWQLPCQRTCDAAPLEDFILLQMMIILATGAHIYKIHTVSLFLLGKHSASLHLSHETLFLLRNLNPENRTEYLNKNTEM